MESVLKKIFMGKSDNFVHSEFIKFSKGKFENRYLLEGKKQKDKWSIKTSAEFANFLVRACLEKTNGEIDVEGVIVSTIDLRKEKGHLFNPEEKIKQFMGVKQLIVNGKIDRQKILDAMEKYPKAFFALTFSTPSFALKIKAKAPKSGKPGSKGEDGPKCDFCSLKTADKAIIEDLFFDFPNFDEIKIKHTLEINHIILPSGITDPVQLREMAKRKGKIIREIEIDGRKEIREKEFEA